MTDSNLPALRNQVREQRQTIRLRQLSLEAKRNERLMESYEYLDRLVDMPDRWAYQDRLISPMGTVLDRRDGQYGPIIRTLNDLDLIRGFARVLNELNPLAIALTGHLTDSIIGTGFTFRAVTKEETRKGELRPLIAATQDVIDEFYEREEFDEFQQELFGRSVVDGESILRHYDLDGFATVRSVEPEQLRVPPRESGVGPWSFGILNARHDVQTPVEFYVTYKDTEDGADGMSGEYVPAADIVHTKRNTPRNVKRGFSDFFPVREDMEAIRKLLHNMVVTGGVQAAVAWFRNWSGSQQSDILKLRGDNIDLSGPRPPSRNDVYFQKVWPGQVVDAPANMRMDGPPQGTMNVLGHVQVVQAMMRAIGIRWRMPEYFTGDASNNNFASITMAGSPFVRYATSQQSVYRRRFLRTIWYAIDCAIAAGRLDRRVKQLVNVEAEAPAIEMADELKKAQADSIAVQGGWKSRQQCAQEDGGDWEQIQADIDTYREANPEAAGQTLQLPPGYGQGAAG